MTKSKIMDVLLFLFYGLFIIAIIFFIIQIFKPKKEAFYKINIESKTSKYNDNTIIFTYYDNQIDHLLVSFNNGSIELKNNDTLTLGTNLDGKTHNLSITIKYKDGTEEKIEKDYIVYKECNLQTQIEKEETYCSKECGEGIKYITTKIVDKKTKRICKEEKITEKCKLRDCEKDPDKGDQNIAEKPTSSNNKNENTSNAPIISEIIKPLSPIIQDNLSTTPSTPSTPSTPATPSIPSTPSTPNTPSTPATPSTPTAPSTPTIPSTPSTPTTPSTNYSCSLSVITGIKGNDGWYKSNVTLQLDAKESTLVSSFGISNSPNATYNSKSTLMISTESKSATYYGHIKYKNGQTTKCSINIKIDKTPPPIPTSVMRNSTSTGAIIKNQNIYRNHKIYWGDYKATDGLSGIDHFEYSTKCSGNKNNNLKESYTYPLNNKTYYDSYYCIRSVDKAGNASSWSSPYYIHIDLIKPTCTISKLGTKLVITGNDTHSGIQSYSFDNKTYSSTRTKTLIEGTKTIAYVKDKAGNIGSCNYIDRIKTMILVGDSRTYYIQTRISTSKRIINPDVYEVESSKVYFVARRGAAYKWLANGAYTSNCPSTNCSLSAADQTKNLLQKLNNEKKYRDIVILSNLGGNDLRTTEPINTVAKNYINKYNNLMKNEWKSTTYLNTSFRLISVNPMDEELAKCIKETTMTNSKIDKFNAIMKQYFPNYYDTNSLIKKASFGTKYDIRSTCPNGDGLHYDKNTDLKLYNLYKEYVFNN